MSEGRMYPELRCLHYLRRKVLYTDEATQLDVGTLPDGALIKALGVEVTTAFNDGTTAVLDIGTSADPDAYATDLDVSSAALVAADDLAQSEKLIAAETDVVCQYDGTGTAATAGRGDVVLDFYADNDL